MITCEQMTAMLNSHADVAGNPAAAQHLASCPTCREAHAAHMALSQQFSALELPEAPAGIEAAVAARIRAHAAAGPAQVCEKRAKSVRWPWLAATLGTGAALVAGASMMFGDAWRMMLLPGGTAPGVVNERLTRLFDMGSLGTSEASLLLGMMLVTAAFLRLSDSSGRGEDETA